MSINIFLKHKVYFSLPVELGILKIVMNTRKDKLQITCIPILIEKWP